MAYYRRRRAAGDTHEAALRRLASKLVEQLHHCLQHREPYREDIAWPTTARDAPPTNHQLTVLFGFYEWACAADLGPLVNPIPAQRTRSAGRLSAHHNPMEDFVVHRRATYRQKVPRPVWRPIPDDAADALFRALRSHRDRALVSFWLSSGARASELLGLRHGTDLDAGANTITVVSKGSRLRETIPASVDLVCLAGVVST